jgi:ribosomal protein S6--L-glutamate ligase
MRICFIYRWENPIMAQVRELFKAEGATVDAIYPEKTTFNLTDLRVDYDLYLLKSGTDSALSLAGMLHMMGAKIINPYPAVAMMRNKFIVMRALQAGCVPIPETYMAPSVDDLLPLLKDGPLITKPYRGSRGIGIKVVQNADDMKDLADQKQILAQRYHTPDDSEGRFHKIFRIGGQIFGSKRIWPLRKYEDKLGEPYVISPELEDIAYKIGDVFGITLYCADIVISDGRPYVVDVNKFGSFMGVPNAPKLLVEHISTLV